MIALEIQNLVKIYGNGLKALSGLDLKIQQGDFFALLGPNGAGKSTTIGVVTSLVNKTSGKVKVFNYDLDEESVFVKKNIGLVPQEFNFNIFEKCIDILIQQAGFYGIPQKKAYERAEKYLKLLNLWDKRNEQSQTLSGGMKRRLMIARALIHEPKLLILDEPTAGVDIEMRREIWEFLGNLHKKDNVTIILTTHYLEEVEQHCNKVAIIHHGKVAIDTTVKEFLQGLSKQKFVLDIQETLHDVKSTDNFCYNKIDNETLEVEFKNKISLNSLFENLDQQKITVESMRVKTNRIEEVFMNLVEGN